MSAPTDFEKHIKRQLLRLSHLLGYPTEPVALRDYIAALSTAGDENAATRVLDRLVSEELERCPTAATIRRLAYDLREKHQEQRRHCEYCGGAGAVVVYRLVTYHGKSMQMNSSEPISGGYEYAMDLARKIAAQPIGADKQQVLSASKACECSKPRALVG